MNENTRKALQKMADELHVVEREISGRLDGDFLSEEQRAILLAAKYIGGAIVFAATTQVTED